MENLVGQTLNRYQIISLLGEGGMGAVYRAHDTTLQRDVAIKIMHPHFARQPNFQERFLQEARTAARLDHPGIVQIHDFGSYRSQLYIVMKFIPGANLEEMLRDLRNHGRWIPLGEAVQLIRQVAQALDYAHRQGVLHRDIKPGNIMVEPEPFDGLPYRPVVTDLGLAKLAQGGMVTQDGASMGTPAYMSPEQALGKVTDARSDVYSLGILLYELATGRLPFNPRTLAEAIQYHVNTAPPSPRSIRPEIPEALEQVILQTLQKDPSRRYQSALALAEALKGAAPAASRVGSAPAGLSGTISLLTEYQNSLVDERGASVFGDFGSPSGPGSQDRIQILAGDQASREIAFKPPSMILGRDPGTDIFIDDPKISRQHVRIEFDGQVYRVTDLNSTNGSFLGNHRLPPNLPQIWRPEETLRTGSAHLRLVRAGGRGDHPEATQRDVRPFEVAPIRPAGTTRVAAAAAPPSYDFSTQLQPGQLKAGEIGQVIVRNLGAPDRFSIHWISPGEELSFTPPYLEVDIPPGQEVVAEFRAEPQHSGLIGGTRSHPFSIQVSPSAGTPQMHHGEVLSKAALPAWAIPLLLVLCLGLVGALAALSGLVFGGGGALISGADATRTANHSHTQIALVVQQTRESGSATARALEGANAATLQSATQTGQAQATLGAGTAIARQTAEGATVAALQAGAQTSVALTAEAQNSTLQAGNSQTASAQQTAQGLASTQTAAALATGQVVAGQTAVVQTAAAQTAAAQTAAAQTVAAQTAAAQTVAAQTAGAQTAAALYVVQTVAAQTAQSAQLTGQAQSATLTAAAQRRVAYLTGGNNDLASDFVSFLQSQGYIVDVISAGDVSGVNFSPYKLILVGADTGSQDNPRDNPWGDLAGSEANYVASSGRPIVGLGRGGSLFFQAANTYINYQQSWVGNSSQAFAVDPSSPYWNSPQNVDLPGDQVLKLYNNNSSFVAVYLPDPVGDVVPIGRQADNSEHYVIIQQGPRYLLWGFDAGPSDMSSRGRRAFINILWNIAP